MVPAPNLLQFNFRGDALDVVRLPDGDVGAVVRRLSETLGLDADAQLRRLDRAAAEGARWAVTATVAATGPDGKTYEVRALPRRSIPMWAATVDASRVDPAIREKLVAYQDDAADVLAAAFLPGGAPSPTLPPGLLIEGARFHRAAADALEGGDLDTARRCMGAAYMLTRAPRQPRQPREPRHGSPVPTAAYVETVRDRVLAALRKGPAPTMRNLRARVMGRSEVITRAVDELVAEGIAVTEQKGPRAGRRVSLAPVAQTGALQ